MIETGDLSETPEMACKNFLKANLNGVIKTMSKMGISTIASYRGAQIFEAIGLNQTLIDDYFTNTASRVEGIGLDTLAAEARHRHQFAYAPRPDERALPWTREEFINGDQAEKTSFNPTTIPQVAEATGSNYQVFREYSDAVNDQSRNLYTLRGLMDFKLTNPKGFLLMKSSRPLKSSSVSRRGRCPTVPFQRKPMRAGDCDEQIGRKSNTGEGGEELDRFTPI